IACAGHAEHAQLRQPVDQAAGQRRALAHRQHDVEIGKFRRGVVLIRERLGKEHDLGPRHQLRPVGTGLCHALPVVQHCHLGHRRLPLVRRATCRRRAGCASAGLERIGQSARQCRRIKGELPMSELRTILRNHMKEKLARDEVVASMTVRLCRTIEIAQIAKTAGFDTIYVDMEHNTLTIGETCQICIAAQQIGITPLVRVPANSPEYICRVLDGGAMGVITPHVRSAEEAREMVNLVKFAPLGQRSSGGALSQYQYRSFPATETNAAMNDATSLVVMMETLAALENVDSIAAVDGVDMLLIGSSDLTNEMGITGQYDHPRLRDAFQRTIAAARKHGKHVGVGGVASRNDLMTQFVQMGARYVSTGTDMAFLMGACVQKAKFVRDMKV